MSAATIARAILKNEMLMWLRVLRAYVGGIY